MKVGIITFHWATNYGAVLQTYALQEALRALGHDVEIINYKPTQYDDTLWPFIRFRKFLNLKSYIITRKKEAKLSEFRLEYLEQTCRFRTLKSLRKGIKDYDVLITGSDQVLNPSFLEHGERNGSTAYFLDFGGGKVKRYAYAASFGVTTYPQNLCEYVKPLIMRFSAVSSRENTGVGIFRQMGARHPVVVCDPTLLHRHDFYDRLINDMAEPKSKSVGVTSYFLRGRDQQVAETLKVVNASLISDESIEEWISAIKHSEHLITNSFHGVMFSLIYHIPFSVVLSTKDNVGMNDRFYTILQPLGLTNRIFSEAEFLPNDIDFVNDWLEIESNLNMIRKTGWDFLRNI